MCDEFLKKLMQTHYLSFVFASNCGLHGPPAGKTCCRVWTHYRYPGCRLWFCSLNGWCCAEGYRNRWALWTCELLWITRDVTFVCLCHSAVSAKVWRFGLSVCRVCLDRSCYYNILIVNGLSNLDETYRQYSLVPNDDLIRFWRSAVKVMQAIEIKPCEHHISWTVWRSKVKVTAGRWGAKDIHVDPGALKSV